MERERKRVAAQKEKEERDKRLYAEQVAASRLRSEQARAGAFTINSGGSSTLLVPPLNHSRDAERNQTRSSKGYPSRQDGRIDDNRSSSGSSKAPSLSPASPQFPQHSLRPASIYSTGSSEDLRLYGSRRNSFANSVNGSIRSMTVPYPVAYPMWSGSTQSLNVMQVPMIPSFQALATAPDMPLLPPNAPFMKQSRQSQHAGDPNSNRSSSRSNERDPGRRYSNASSSSLHRHDKSGTSPSSPSDSRPTHTRQPSAESWRTRASSQTQQPQRPSLATIQPKSPPLKSHTLPSRGRAQPSFINSAPQVPSPWTALPSRSGTLPTAMPVSSYTHMQGRGAGFNGQMGHDWRSTLIS